MGRIPLSIPNLDGNEKKYISECIDTNFVSSVGPFVSRFENEFASFVGTPSAVAVVNGTSAIHIALMLSGVKAGDEVIVPNLTFVATLNPIKYIGAHPVIVDSSWDNLGMCPKSVAKFLTENTKIVNGECINTKTQRRVKALLPVHVMGNACDIEALVSLAREHQLEVVEDAAECLGAKLNGKSLGTFGRFGCFSFNGNKIMTTGGGGMIVSSDEDLSKKAKHLTTTAKIDPIEFDHDEVGYNYRMVNPLAALGVAQLEQMPKFLEAKKRNFTSYKQKIAQINNLELHEAQPKSEATNHWFYSLVVGDSYGMTKDQLVKHLIEVGVEVRPIWKLMEDLPMYSECQKMETPVSRDIFNRVVSLPCSTHLTEEQVSTVCERLAKVGN